MVAVFLGYGLDRLGDDGRADVNPETLHPFCCQPVMLVGPLSSYTHWPALRDNTLGEFVITKNLLPFGRYPQNSRHVGQLRSDFSKNISG
jgi:hypothetical protein